MEDLVTFTAVFAVLLSILLIATSASLSSFYTVASAQKEFVKNAEATDVVLLRMENNGLVRTDRVVVLEENNGTLTVRNVGSSDFFWVRLVCWDPNDPASTVRLVDGVQNGVTYSSVPFLSIYPPHNEINYPVSDGNQCVLVGRRFLRGFVLPR